MSDPELGGHAIGARLFVGYFGSICRAVTPAGDEVRALVVDGELAGRAGFDDAFFRAGRDLSGFEHPNAVATLATERDAAGRLLAITEPIDQPVSLLGVSRDAGGPAAAAVAAAVAREAAGAVAAAHERGLVHGAVHPRSVLLAADGRVRVADFAASRALAEVASGSDDSELFQGARGYLAPELVLGEPPGPATDVYALGALVFELWTGAPPPGELDALPAPVSRVVERALRSDPIARFDTAGEFERALSAALARAGILPAPGWQVIAWVRELGSARARRLDADTRELARDLGTGERDLSRVPDVAPQPRQGNLSLAAAAARARALRTGAPHATPTPLADAGDVLGLSSTEDPLGRIDAALAGAVPGALPDEPHPDEGAGRPAAGADAPRRATAGEIAGFVLALAAVIAAAALVFGGCTGASDSRERGAVLRSEPPLLP